MLELLRTKGHSEYGSEAVTQLEHALQAAELAVEAGADAPLITAALLHDVGHMLHDLPEDAPDQGIDDRHEELGAHWLEQRFGADVVEPVRLHVPAKRFLCATDPSYQAALSEPSRLSLELQGGAMDAEEVRAFEQHPQHDRAVQLRRWDDEAKVPAKPTPPLEAFRESIAAALAGES